MLKIIVTGPESSGKTTLCKALSKHYKLPFTKEYARKYLADMGKNNEAFYERFSPEKLDKTF